MGHGVEEAAQAGGEGVGAVLSAGGQLGKQALGQQADVFGEQAEEEAHEEVGGGLGVVAATL